MTSSHAFIDVPGMSRAEQNAGNTFDTNNRIANSVENTAVTLQSSYSGEAATGFTQAMNHWNEQFTKVQQSLADLRETLQISGGKYTHTEAQAVDAVTVVRRAMLG